MVKPGATYYGTIRHDSFMSNARIRFTKANLETGELTLVIESRIQQGIYTEFKGAIDPAEGLISVESSAGRINKSGYLRVPFFTYDNNYTLSLQLTEEAITGVITNDTSWKLNFLVNKPFTSASSPDGKSDSSASATSYPTKVGAYILSSGKWEPLPTNKGQYKTAWASAFGDLLKVNGESATSKLADLIFSGSDETPTVDGAEVAILFVGTLEHPAQNLIAQYPQLADYPPMEVAATTTLKDGNRQADIVRIVPGFGGFGDKRCAATVQEVGDNQTLLTCTAPLAPGSYAFAVNSQSTPAFEFRVR